MVASLHPAPPQCAAEPGGSFALLGRAVTRLVEDCVLDMRVSGNGGGRQQQAQLGGGGGDHGHVSFVLSISMYDVSTRGRGSKGCGGWEGVQCGCGGGCRCCAYCFQLLPREDWCRCG